jgi:hypothetical protein
MNVSMDPRIKESMDPARIKEKLLDLGNLINPGYRDDRMASFGEVLAHYFGDRLTPAGFILGCRHAILGMEEERRPILVTEDDPIWCGITSIAKAVAPHYFAEEVRRSLSSSRGPQRRAAIEHTRNKERGHV